MSPKALAQKKYSEAEEHLEVENRAGELSYEIKYDADHHSVNDDDYCGNIYGG